MSTKKPVVGCCHICGNYGPLTFEHVPPKKAFNDRPALLAEFEDALARGPGQLPSTGKIQQRGFGSYTLCSRCNSNTGSWYAPAFIEWCEKGLRILEASRGKPSLVYANEVCALRVIKQILAMFCSVSPPSFAQCNPDMTAFLLNREERHLDPKYGVFVYYNVEGLVRMWGPSGLLRLDTSAGGLKKECLMSEIAFPPYGYVLTIDSPCPDARLVNISYFAKYGIDDQIIFSRALAVLPTHLALPGDYRSTDEIWRDYWNNRLLEALDRAR